MLRPSAVFGDQPPTLSLVAPAKVNLFLRILRKREDGFHELASLFQTVSLFDDLDFWLLPREADQPLCSMEVRRRRGHPRRASGTRTQTAAWPTAIRCP